MISAPTAVPPGRYATWLAGFLLCLALTLLTLVDVRRGFLFAEYGVRTPFLVLSSWHALMAPIGLLGMLFCHRRIRAMEHGFAVPAHVVRRFAFAIAALLIVDLFAYRLVPATRSLAAGQVNADWLAAFGTTGAQRPVALATSYLLTVWHATMLGILLSGLLLAVLPASFAPFQRRGVGGSLAGSLFALPQPFCSCCSSALAPALVRAGASTQFLLAFVVGSPMLNVTTIALAVSLLPARFAVTRIVAGIVVAVLVTYGVARLSSGAGVGALAVPVVRPSWRQRAAAAYFGWFSFPGLNRGPATETASRLVATWLRLSAGMALVLVPLLWGWSVIAAMAFDALQGRLDNGVASVIVAAVVGTFFMISTWAEIPIALQLIRNGLDGPAAALLVVLPAISLPCLMILGGALRQFRVVALLSGAVMLAGITAGLVFL